MIPTLRCALYVSAIVVLASTPACAGSPSDPNSPGGPGEIREVKEDPSFGQDILDIFQREGCAQGACHGVGASVGLNLERDSAYANLVGVPATQEGYERVTAENPQESYLVIKLEGRQQVGTRMPPSGNPLDAIDMGNIKNWITKGAKNN